jgi:IclR family pca regulon transcriptional regulator
VRDAYFSSSSFEALSEGGLTQVNALCFNVRHAHFSHLEIPDMKLARRDFVASLEHGLGVIEAFDARHPKLTLSEVAERTGMTRASARRYLLTLAKLGYADYDGKLFSLDLRVLRLGYGLLSAAPLPRKAQPVLDMVSSETGEMASVAVMDETAVVFLGRSQSRKVFSPTVGVGTRLPAFCLSTGRVLLAQRSDAEVNLLLGHTTLTAFTDRTLTQVDDILAAVRAARAQGYAISDEEYELGLRSIAVPVPSATGLAEVAMTVSIHASQASVDEMVERLLPPLRRGAEALATLL